MADIAQVIQIEQTSKSIDKIKNNIIEFRPEIKISKEKKIKPILKWAGGKGQLLKNIIPEIPASYRKYIEPFFGGGALFFELRPDQAVIADSNPELMNVYQQVALNVDDVIAQLKLYVNDEAMFYAVRSQCWQELKPSVAAARTIYLNKTCYNGLYRVNKKGEFNTPFGRYKNPKICDEDNLRAASELLKTAEIVCGDYKDVLNKYARKGDFIFLDPPYVPVSEYADFKRYTKEQFHEKDQRELTEEVSSLQSSGVYVLLTNSNAELVRNLYGMYPHVVIPSKRSISSNGNSRKSEDVIVRAYPSSSIDAEIQTSRYPATRFMGSKNKLLKEIWNIASNFNAKTAIDLFSGSGVVGYMLKAHGLSVTTNDYMHMSYIFAKAMIENNSVVLPIKKAEELLKRKQETDHFVSDTFQGLYFTDEENELIDTIRANIAELSDPAEKTIAMTALIRACMKKRPRGLFTYVGLGKYDDGRNDLKLSLREQFLNNVAVVNAAVFNNGKLNKAVCGDAMELSGSADLVYIDPPYYSPYSDNEYVRRYHFVEGLARDWKGVEIQQNTKTKKFKNYTTPFSTKNGAEEAFDQLFKRYRDSVLIVSYSSNSYPDRDTMLQLLSKYKTHVNIVPIDYTYSFGNQRTASTHRNKVQEYLFVGYNNSNVK